METRIAGVYGSTVTRVCPVYLQLVKSGGDYRLRLVDESGQMIDQGNILTITLQGIIRHASLNPGVGLDLDSLGRIMVIE
jgi:hypothetical protein